MKLSKILKEAEQVISKQEIEKDLDTISNDLNTLNHMIGFIFGYLSQPGKKLDLNLFGQIVKQEIQNIELKKQGKIK